MFVVAIDDDLCTGCGECSESCPARILSMKDDKAYVSGDAAECMGCESCTTVCPSGAVSIMEM